LIHGNNPLRILGIDIFSGMFTGYAEAFFKPGSQIHQFATLRAKWPERIISAIRYFFFTCGTGGNQGHCRISGKKKYFKFA